VLLLLLLLVLLASSTATGMARHLSWLVDSGLVLLVVVQLPCGCCQLLDMAAAQPRLAVLLAAAVNAIVGAGKGFSGSISAVPIICRLNNASQHTSARSPLPAPSWLVLSP
jgi:hypothetical protein